MADARSVIRVAIIGSAKDLQKSLKTADSQLGKFGASLKGVAVGIGALVVADKITDFVRTATEEADRLADSATRLNAQLGPELATNVEKAAAGFTKIGLSTQDVQERAADFADLATSVGIADSAIASFAPNVVATAQAMALLGHGELTTNVDLIGKAAAGSAKAAKELGVTLLSGVDPATQLTNILAQLKPQLDSVTTGSVDLEQKQSQLQARMETLSAQAGGPLSDALSSVLQFILDEIDALPGAIEGWARLGRQFEDLGRTLLTPLARLKDLNDELAKAASTPFVVSPGRTPRSDSATTRAVDRDRARNGLSSVLGGP